MYKLTAMHPEVSKYRRERIVALLQEGKSQNQVANLLGCSQSRVSETAKRWREEGPQGLANRPREHGPKPKLSQGQMDELARIVAGPATEHGFENDVWNQRRVAHVIFVKFNVGFHVNSICRLMKKLGFSYKRPTVKDSRQDPEKVARYVRDTLPELAEAKKKRERGGL